MSWCVVAETFMQVGYRPSLVLAGPQLIFSTVSHRGARPRVPHDDVGHQPRRLRRAVGRRLFRRRRRVHASRHPGVLDGILRVVSKALVLVSRALYRFYLVRVFEPSALDTSARSPPSRSACSCTERDRTGSRGGSSASSAENRGEDVERRVAPRRGEHGSVPGRCGWVFFGSRRRRPQTGPPR